MPQLTERQAAIKELLDLGWSARDIADSMGITRNAVYQQIQRMRKYGALPAYYTPTGLPAREAMVPNVDRLAQLIRESQGGDGDGDGNGGNTAVAGALALVQEIKRTRDELDAIARRLSALIPR